MDGQQGTAQTHNEFEKKADEFTAHTIAARDEFRRLTLLVDSQNSLLVEQYEASALLLASNSLLTSKVEGLEVANKAAVKEVAVLREGVDKLVSKLDVVEGAYRTAAKLADSQQDTIRGIQITIGRIAEEQKRTSTKGLSTIPYIHFVVFLINVTTLPINTITISVIHSSLRVIGIISTCCGQEFNGKSTDPSSVEEGDLFHLTLLPFRVQSLLKISQETRTELRM